MTGQKLVTVVGARPQFIKAAAVTRAMEARRNRGLLAPAEILVHTGQHYDYEMSAVFFDQLQLPKPDYHLGVGSGTHGAQTGQMLGAIEKVLIHQVPTMVLVYGDTNSTLAASLAAVKLGLGLAHVEAGLRSWRRTMPEETNRVVADHVATLLFCPTPQAVANLTREGIGSGVHLVGDVMYDVLASRMGNGDEDLNLLQDVGVEVKRYALATIHRAANTDNPDNLHSILEGLRQIVAGGLPVVVPLHPRTKAALDGWVVPKGLQILPPVSYDTMLALERHAQVILTDSGGVQKEAYWLGVPCVSLRQETEWVETLEGGWNTLVGVDPDRIVEAACRPRPQAPRRADIGGGQAADRIVEVLAGTDYQRRHAATGT